MIPVLILITLSLVMVAGVVQYLYVSEKLKGCSVEAVQFFLIFLGMFIGSAIMVSDLLYLWPYRLIISFISGVAGVIGMRQAKRMTQRQR
jgi:hypothetical protein